MSERELRITQKEIEDLAKRLHRRDISLSQAVDEPWERISEVLKEFYVGQARTVLVEGEGRYLKE